MWCNTFCFLMQISALNKIAHFTRIITTYGQEARSLCSNLSNTNKSCKNRNTFFENICWQEVVLLHYQHIRCCVDDSIARVHMSDIMLDSRERLLVTPLLLSKQAKSWYYNLMLQLLTTLLKLLDLSPPYLLYTLPQWYEIEASNYLCY